MAKDKYFFSLVSGKKIYAKMKGDSIRKFPLKVYLYSCKTKKDNQHGQKYKF